jgi:hypothetical protein
LDAIFGYPVDKHIELSTKIIKVIPKTDEIPAEELSKSKVLQNQINNQQSRSSMYSKTNVKRFLVPNGKQNWEMVWLEYRPVQYTDDSVLKNTSSDRDIDLIKYFDIVFLFIF